MTKKTSDSAGEFPAAVEKKLYTSPSLKTYGSVSEFTRGASGHHQDWSGGKKRDGNHHNHTN
jgi:hypothetical protein